MFKLCVAALVRLLSIFEGRFSTGGICESEQLHETLTKYQYNYYTKLWDRPKIVTII